jgi:oxepin-CoA hydrolase / 3-oxo-5,6-dehydrosuberyl-CoA semialdehyde dehydrogenase
MGLEDRPLIDMSVDQHAFFKVRVPEIINGLTGEEQPEWGMLTAQHMVEHLIFPLQFATGELKVGNVVPPEKQARQREFLMGPYGMPKNFKMPLLPADSLAPLIGKTLQESKDLLLQKVQAFLDRIDDPAFETELHPIFGDLDKAGWLAFQYKHFYHHFTQFGLL